jgi:hypothetical protein
MSGSRGYRFQYDFNSRRKLLFTGLFLSHILADFADYYNLIQGIYKSSAERMFFTMIYF